jgi:MFS transporter, MHS family, proline/betaine transporter
MSVAQALPQSRTRSARVLAAGAIGNILEWYDFAVYGYLASIFGRNFFPSDERLLSLLSAFAVFAIAFMMRPLGGIVFGHIGDRFGRKSALLTSVVAMALSTFAIGVLPTYAMIGVVAPVLLVILRMIQGASVGGEFTISIIFLVEQSPSRRRGFIGSWASFSASAGIVLGSAVGALVASLLDRTALTEWGWRVPFLFGIALGGLAYVLRRRSIDETFEVVQFNQLPVVEALKTDWRDMVRGFIIIIALSGNITLVFIYLATWLQQVDEISAARALAINTFGMIVMLIFVPVFGSLSDRFGRKPILLASLAGFIVFSWPLLRLLDSTQDVAIIIGEVGFAIIIAAFSGTMPAAMVELYPQRIRCSALSLSYNTAAGLAGGVAPMIAVYLMGITHSPMSPALYLVAAAAISMLGVVSMPNRTGQPLS